MSHADLFQILFNNVHEGYSSGASDFSTNNKAKNKKIKLQNKTNTAQQVRLYTFNILAHQLTQNKLSRNRSKVIDFMTRNLQSNSQKSAFIGILTVLIRDKMISSQFFQRNFLDSFLQLMDDTGATQCHVIILRDLARDIVPLMYDDPVLLDKLTYQINHLRQRCESQVQNSAQKTVKIGNVHRLVLQEIDSFNAYMRRKDLKEEIRQYLRTVDKEIQSREDILIGVFRSASRNSRDYHSIKDE